MAERRNFYLISILGICLSLVTGIAMAQSSENYSISSDIIAGSGGPVSSANYSLDATAGQMATGYASSSQYSLSGGYWESSVGDSEVYLPVILKSSG